MYYVKISFLVLTWHKREQYTLPSQYKVDSSSPDPAERNFNSCNAAAAGENLEPYTSKTN